MSASAQYIIRRDQFKQHVELLAKQGITAIPLHKEIATNLIRNENATVRIHGKLSYLNWKTTYYLIDEESEFAILNNRALITLKKNVLTCNFNLAWNSEAPDKDVLSQLDVAIWNAFSLKKPPFFSREIARDWFRSLGCMMGCGALALGAASATFFAIIGFMEFLSNK
jgi:hypothetical protein